MASLENLSAAHTLLLISALLECFVALGWLLAAVVLPRFRLVSLHWSAGALSMGAAFFGYLGSSGLPNAQDINSVMQTSARIVTASRVRYVFP